MTVYILTLFPEFFKSPLDTSILKRAQEKQALNVQLVNIRDYSQDKHKRVDDVPYGGGHGMLMTCQPLFDCIEDIRTLAKPQSPVVFFSPHGQDFTQKIANSYASEFISQEKDLILLCGHYEGIDERARQALVDREICIGHYILTGWEPAALCFLDAITRPLPGVLWDEESHKHESFSEYLEGKLEYPQYTRPEEFRGMNVPEVLLSGHHANIEVWKKQHMKNK